MKHDGAIESEDVATMLRSLQEELTAEMHVTVDTTHRELVEKIDYILDQTTDHQQEMKEKVSALKKTVDHFYDSMRRGTSITMDGIHETHVKINKLTKMIWGAVALNVITLVTILVLL